MNINFWSKKLTEPKYFRQRGNAIIMLFAAIGMAGMVTYGLNTVMRGPATTGAEISRKTMAENNLIASSRLAVSAAARSGAGNGDCDGDGFVEALPYRDKGTDPAPVGGGLIPLTMGASVTDPWGIQYGYCVWDPGTLTVTDNVAACGGNTALRLTGSPRDDQPAIALISAGKNGVFETSCAAYVDTTPADGLPDAAMVNKPAGSDDIVLTHTYAEANGIGGGEWQIKVGDATTAVTAKGINVTGGAEFTGALDVTGGFMLPQSTGGTNTTGACDASKDQQLRMNISVDPPMMEICNASGAGWTQVSGGGGDATCSFADPLFIARKTGGISKSENLNGNFYSFSQTGGGACTVYSYDNVDLSNPLVQDSLTDCTNMQGPIGFTSSGVYLYTANGADNSVGVFNIADPANITFAGKITSALLQNANALSVISGQYIAVTSASDDRLTVVNATTPAAPVIAGGGAATLQNAAWLNGANAVRVVSTYAYVSAKDADAITAVNVATPTAPALAGHVTAPGSELNDPGIILTKGQYLYVLSKDAGAQYITTIDISDPANPAYTASLSDARLAGIKVDAKIYGKYLFVLTAANTLLIYDLSNPVAPVFLEEFTNIISTPGGFSLRENYLYVGGTDTTSSTSGLYVYNLGCNPLNGNVDTSVISDTVGSATTDTLDSDLLAHYEFEEGAGSIVKDSAADNDGTFVYTPKWIPGFIGKGALSFNAANGEGVEIPTVFGQPRSFTVATWMNITDYDSSGEATVFSIGDSFVMILDENDGSLYVGYEDGGAWTSLIPNTAMDRSGWLHLAVTLTDVDNRFRIYVNGELVASSAPTADIIWNGGYSYIGVNAGTRDYSGAVDDLRVYSRELGPGEVYALYERTKALSNVPDAPEFAPQSINLDGQIGLGNSTGCGIKSDGTLWCWGQDSSGSRGDALDEATTNFGYPQHIDRGNRYTYLSQHTAGPTMCAIRVDGSLWCWGANNFGQTGAGDTANKILPTRVPSTLPWVIVSTSTDHACGIKNDGSLWCWGSDSTGQMGNGAATGTQLVPIQVAGSWVHITARSGEGTCGIKIDGSGWCWGSNINGVLGQGSFTLVSSGQSPSPLGQLGPWTKLSTWSRQGGGVKADGSAWVWGQGYSATPTPIPGPMLKYTDYDAGRHRLALSTTGKVFLFYTSGGFAGFIPGADWTSIQSSNYTQCGMRADGMAACWGDNTENQTGEGPYSGSGVGDPKPVIYWVMPGAFSWSDDATYTIARGDLALGNTYLSSDAADATWFGFKGTGKAILNRTVANNELLLATTSANSSSQTSFVTTDTSTANYTTSMSVRWGLDSAVATATETSATGSRVLTPTGAAWMPNYGRVTGALSFDGIDDYATSPDIAALKPAAISVGAWVYVEDVTGPPGTTNYIITKPYAVAANSTSHVSYALGIQNTGGPRFSFEIGTNSGTVSTKAISPIELQKGVWYHILGTYSMATGVNLYVNSALSATAAQSSAILYDTSPFYMGRDDVAAPTGFFKGIIDDVRIYSVAITGANVQTIYRYYTNLFHTQRLTGVDYSNGNFEIVRRTSPALLPQLDLWSSDINSTLAGLMGIGTDTPMAAVDVNGAVKFGPDYDCSAVGQAGKIRYVKGATTEWQYCNGTAWTDLPSGAAKLWRRDQKSNGGSCNIRSNGAAWCWGSSDNGKLGNGTTTGNDVSLPSQVQTTTGPGGWSDWIMVRKSDTHSCGIRYNGEAYCWGNSGSGKLGNPSFAGNITRPVIVQTDTGPGSWTDWIHIVVGGDTSCGIRSNGTAWCWGRSESVGKLGDGTTGTTQARPIQVQTDTGPGGWSDWIHLSLASSRVCGLRSNGTAWCWGDASNGALGNGTTTPDMSRPVQVQTDTGPGGWSDWIDISVSSAHTCGVRSNGTAWCWGAAFYGRLGNGDSGTARSRPVQVQTDTGPSAWSDWRYIATVSRNTCGLRSSGTLWCWGEAASGKLANGTTTPDVNRPVQVQTDTGPGGWSDWTSIGDGCGARVNGTYWCWGPGTSGRLGNGTFSATQSRPVQVDP